MFQSVKSLPAFILFAGFFSGLIFILTTYILSNKAVNQTVISTVFLTAIAIIFISFLYYPYRYFIEKFNNWIRAFIFVLLLFGLFSFIKSQITTLPFELISVSLTTIVSLILIVLLGKCLGLMYRDLISEKDVTPIDPTIDIKRKNKGLTIENHTKPNNEELTEK